MSIAKRLLELPKDSAKRREGERFLSGSTYWKDDKVIVFNSQKWSKTGDIGDNSQFYQNATVNSVRKDKEGRWLADVTFENGTVSNGHFQDGIKWQ